MLMAKLEEQGPSTKGEETRIMGSTNNDSKGDDFIPFTNEAVHMLHAQQVGNTVPVEMASAIARSIKYCYEYRLVRLVFR